MTYFVAPIEERRLHGIGILLLGQVALVLIDPSAKWLGAHGIPTTEIVFVRYAIHFGLTLAFFLPQVGRGLFVTRNLRLEVLRGLFLLSTTAFNFVAVQFLPLTTTGALMFTVPLIICALSIPLLGEHIGWRRWVAIGVGFAGILVIVRPGSASFQPAALLSLCGATGAALYSIYTRKLAGVDTAATQQFYAALTAMVCVAPFAFSGWVWPHDPATWLAFGAVGVSGMIGHQLMTMAHRFAPASTLAPFTYLQVVHISIVSWLVFNQPPDIWIFLGAPIVIGSGLYIWLRERSQSRPITVDATQD